MKLRAPVQILTWKQYFGSQSVRASAESTQMKFTEILIILQQQKGDNHIVTSRQMTQRQIVVLICTKPPPPPTQQDKFQAGSGPGCQTTLECKTHREKPGTGVLREWPHDHPKGKQRCCELLTQRVPVHTHTHTTSAMMWQASFDNLSSLDSSSLPHLGFTTERALQEC